MIDWRGWITLGIAIAIMMACGVCAAADKAVIAHRGASGYLPEHTLEAYAMAYACGADYIEQDLVLTKDKRFISLHDIHLEATTNVEEKFPDRKRPDGRWYAADFTLAEIKTLDAHERISNRFPVGKSRFEVPTFEEAIELIQGLNASTGRNVGIYPELKAPSWHAKEGLPMEQAFLDVVARYGYQGPQARIFVQCFEPPTLKKLRQEYKCELPMIQLLSDSKLQDASVTEAGLDAIAAYANGIGPDKSRLDKNPDLARWAHARGLQVHPYTLRRDELGAQYKSSADELRQFYVTYDVDALFTDFPDDAADFLKEQGLHQR